MRSLFTLLFFLGVVPSASALTFSLGGEEVVGHFQTAIAKEGDSLAQVARDYDMGYEEMVEANPTIDDPNHLVAGTVLVVPSTFILPHAPRKGIVINLAEMRLYYYPSGGGQVTTHPMGIGREGEDTIVGAFSVIQRIKDPTWRPTAEMKKLREAEGVTLPDSVPPGPENPMGNFALRLSRPTYLIHGTNDPLGGVGRRSSSGCMRLYPEDIESLFHKVSTGTPVYIVNEPYKAGWSSQGELFLESHISLKNEDDQATQDAAHIRQIVETAVRGRSAEVDWDKVDSIAAETQGFPQQVGRVLG